MGPGGGPGGRISSRRWWWRGRAENYSSQAAPPIKVMKEYQPVKVTPPPGPASQFMTSARTAQSMPKLTVRGPAGASVRMIPHGIVRRTRKSRRPS